MNILFFDYREAEHEYFKDNPNNDFNIKFIETPLNDETQISEQDSDDTCIVSIFMTSKITGTVLDKFKNLRAIATRTTGYDHIDIAECARRNIRVLNVEHYGKTSVTEFTIGAMIALVRNIVPAVRDLQHQNIEIKKYLGRDLNELTLGVIGTGAIGSSVCQAAKALGMKVLANDKQKNLEITSIVEYVDFETLLKNSNIITLHIPYTQEAYHLISEYELSLMKDGSYIINTARGELIDTIALYNSIQSGKIKGCALDVLECENIVFNNTNENILHKLNKSNKNCIENALIIEKLSELDNVIITPHIAYNTTEAINTILETTICNIRDYLKGGNNNRVV